METEPLACVSEGEWNFLPVCRLKCAEEEEEEEEVVARCSESAREEISFPPVGSV